MRIDRSVDIPALVFGLTWSLIIRGVLLVFVIGIPIGTVLQLALSPQLTADLLASGEPPSVAEIAARANSDAIQGYGLVATCIAVALSAYWVARRAGFLRIYHGACTGLAFSMVASYSSSLVTYLSSTSQGRSETASPASPIATAAWFVALSWTLIVAAGAFGGWVASKRGEPGG